MTTPQTPPQTRVLDWAAIVRKAEGKEWNKPEPGYEFTNRKFDTPKEGGPYAPQE